MTFALLSLKRDAHTGVHSRADFTSSWPEHLLPPTNLTVSEKQERMVQHADLETSLLIASHNISHLFKSYHKVMSEYLEVKAFISKVYLSLQNIRI